MHIIQGRCRPLPYTELVMLSGDGPSMNNKTPIRARALQRLRGYLIVNMQVEIKQNSLQTHSHQGGDPSGGQGVPGN